MSDAIRSPRFSDEKLQNAMAQIYDIAVARWRSVLRQREEILAAFIAKYGLEPDEVEQVSMATNEGEVWFVRKKTMQ